MICRLSPSHFHFLIIIIKITTITATISRFSQTKLINSLANSGLKRQPSTTYNKIERKIGTFDAFGSQFQRAITQNLLNFNAQLAAFRDPVNAPTMEMKMLAESRKKMLEESTGKEDDDEVGNGVLNEKKGEKTDLQNSISPWWTSDLTVLLGVISLVVFLSITLTLGLIRLINSRSKRKRRVIMKERFVGKRGRSKKRKRQLV